jgi:alkylation response protein AidB-like acyl-CoA dehydrogenase
MDFSFSSLDSELYSRALHFARTDLNVAAAARIAERRFGGEEWGSAAQFGLTGMCIPEAYGGMGLSMLGTARLMEALGHGCDDAGLLFSLGAHVFACAVPIWKLGCDEMRASLLPKLARGAWIGANAITESEAGSDVFALQASAARDGDGYVIDGSKSWVTNGPVADVFLVYARTNPKHGYLGVSAFVVERGRPGLSLGKPIDKVGLETSPTCSLYLDRCRVPKENLVGREGQGAPLFEIAMAWERTCLFGIYVGRMDKLLVTCIERARARRQFGHAIGEFQAVSHRISDMKLRLEAARLLLYRACDRCDRGEDARLDVAMAKVAVSEAAVQNGLDAMRIFGGDGIMSEAGVDRYLRDALPATVVSGTSDVQRNLIARYLGL